MNSKVATVIAGELGILIAILAWLAFPNLARVKQPVTEEQTPAEGSFATVTALPGQGNQRHPAVDYRANTQGQQVAAQPQAQTLQYGTMQYDQQVAPAPYTTADVNDGYIPETSPYYTEPYQETVPYPPDCLYSPFDEFALYPPTSQIIIVSNTRTFVRRPRPAVRFAPPRMMPPRTMVVQRRPAGGQVQPRGGGVVSRRTANPRSFQPSPGVRPH
jgi:hypothetical protein